MFSPKGHEEFIGELSYSRRGRTETDHDLYFDNDSLRVFVVSTESVVNSPAGNTIHTRYTLAEYLGIHPDCRQRMVDLLHLKLGKRVDGKVNARR
jgi:hypothetical protein